MNEDDLSSKLGFNILILTRNGFKGTTLAMLFCWESLLCLSDSRADCELDQGGDVVQIQFAIYVGPVIFNSLGT